MLSTALGATAVNTASVASILATTLRRGTQVGLTLRTIKDVEQDCGVGDYERVAHEFAVFFHLYPLFSDFEQYHQLDYHPDVLKIKSCEFGDKIKQGLSCLTLSSSGRSLSFAIDQLVLAINTRLDLTKMVKDF